MNLPRKKVCPSPDCASAGACKAPSSRTRGSNLAVNACLYLHNMSMHIYTRWGKNWFPVVRTWSMEFILVSLFITALFSTRTAINPPLPHPVSAHVRMHVTSYWFLLSLNSDRQVSPAPPTATSVVRSHRPGVQSPFADVHPPPERHPPNDIAPETCPRPHHLPPGRHHCFLPTTVSFWVNCTRGGIASWNLLVGSSRDTYPNDGSVHPQCPSRLNLSSPVQNEVQRHTQHKQKKSVHEKFHRNHGSPISYSGRRSRGTGGRTQAGRRQVLAKARLYPSRKDTQASHQHSIKIFSNSLCRIM